uniref:Uncharacterized protein n=1 Tax=Lepeophtheirus salmonis TaxID=72036 RepID=A0A0K2TDY5_LEPSM
MGMSLIRMDIVSVSVIPIYLFRFSRIKLIRGVTRREVEI